MVVLPTLSEDDLKDIGVVSFGTRRKITVLVKKLNQPLVEPSASLNESDEQTSHNSEGSGKENKRKVESPPSFINTSRLVMNIEEAMQKHPEGMAITNHLHNGGLLSSQQRRALVKICVSHLVDKCGLYPTSEQKTLLAMEIVKAYPSTKDDTPGMSGHEHFYHDGHGFIEYRLKNIRTSRPDECRRKKKRCLPSMLSVTSSSTSGSHGKDVEVNDEEPALTQDLKEKISWMKYTPPSQGRKPELIQHFIETHQYRQHMIKISHPSITTIIEEYPRYKDVPELVNLEFRLLYPNHCDNFLMKWDSYFKERIIALGKEEYPAVKQLISSYKENDDLCAFYVLVYMLHRSSNRKKDFCCTREDSVKYLIQNYPFGTDIAAKANEKQEKYSQPYLITVGAEQNPTQFSLVLDRIAIPSSSQHLVQSIDMLFKSHYAFNVEYASPLQQFWEFVASMMYGILDPTKTRPSVRALGSVLSKMS